MAVATALFLLRRPRVLSLFPTLAIPLCPTLKGFGGIIVILGVSSFPILQEFHDAVQFWFLKLALVVFGSYGEDHCDEFFVRLPEAV